MIHLVFAVERSLISRNLYAGLILALSLPDIAGWVDHPTKKSPKRYSAWFEQFVSPAYTHKIGADRNQHKFLTGDDCYALRCSFLHEGRDVTSHQRARKALDRFQFVAPPPSGMIHCNKSGSKLQLQVDIFCRDICDGIKDWISSIPENDSERRGRLAELAVIDPGCGNIHI